MKYLTYKEVLTIIIQQQGDCYNINCYSCPLAINGLGLACGYDENTLKDAKYKWVELGYTLENLFEILL